MRGGKGEIFFVRRWDRRRGVRKSRSREIEDIGMRFFGWRGGTKRGRGVDG